MDGLGFVNPEDFRPGAGDDKLLVVFHMDIVKDEGASIEQGRPIFNDTEFVKIFVPGDKTNVVDRPVRQSDKLRFPKQYEAFREGKSEDEQLQGTPLRDWPMMGRSQVAELHYFGIRTVEQLSEVRDDICMKVPGLLGLKQTAGVWLQKAKSTAEAAKVAKRMEDAETQVADLRAAQSELLAMNKALQDQLREFIAQRMEVAKA